MVNTRTHTDTRTNLTLHCTLHSAHHGCPMKVSQALYPYLCRGTPDSSLHGNVAWAPPPRLCRTCRFCCGCHGCRCTTSDATPLVAGGAPALPGHPHAGLPHPKPHNISHILGNATKPATTAPLDLSGPEVNGNHSSGSSRPRSPVDDVPPPKKLKTSTEESRQ